MQQRKMELVKRIVVKIGTSTLAKDDGQLDIKKITEIVSIIAKLIHNGYEVCLVSSGAVGAGMGILGLEEKPRTLTEKQTLSAVGQVELIRLYQELFHKEEIFVGQLLLTKDDFANRERYLSMRSVCNNLLGNKRIAIFNENDPVVCNEIKVGDNDTLSALVSGLIDADLLIIMSDIDGLYDKNPTIYKDAKRLPLVTTIDQSIKMMATDTNSKFGTGGMATKIIAAEMATNQGTNMAIINGDNPKNIQLLLDGIDIGTIFTKQEKKMNAKKYWLAYGPMDIGAIMIDAGAKKALDKGKSLLPVGVVSVHHQFNRGDVVTLLNENGEKIARGISNYSANEIAQLIDVKTADIDKILGYKYADEIIHANNMALL